MLEFGAPFGGKAIRSCACRVCHCIPPCRMFYSSTASYWSARPSCSPGWLLTWSSPRQPGGFAARAPKRPAELRTDHANTAPAGQSPDDDDKAEVATPKIGSTFERQRGLARRIGSSRCLAPHLPVHPSGKKR